MSLFERLVHSGMPLATLTTQHRMHPDIARFIRPTYPKLLDSPLVSSREPVKGFRPDLRVAFVSHQFPEGGQDEDQDEMSMSYSNAHEADMVAGIVQYFRNQGYSTDQIVVLTPYLGQLRLIMSKLREGMMSKKDAALIREQDPTAQKDPRLAVQVKGAEVHQKGIRVSSIDNYQVRMNHLSDFHGSAF